MIRATDHPPENGLMNVVKFGTLVPGYGEAELITGPMFTGKSTEALRRADHYRYCRDTLVLHVKPTTDNRDAATVLLTHGGYSAPCHLQASSGPELIRVLRRYVRRYRPQRLVVIGDEAQFIQDLGKLVEWVQYHPAEPVVVHLILAALNTKFDQSPWPEISAVFHRMARVDALSGICMCCQAAPSVWSRRNTESKADVVIAAEDKYSAVCGPCYHHTGCCARSQPSAIPLGVQGSQLFRAWLRPRPMVSTPRLLPNKRKGEPRTKTKL